MVKSDYLTFMVEWTRDFLEVDIYYSRKRKLREMGKENFRAVTNVILPFTDSAMETLYLLLKPLLRFLCSFTKD